MAPRVQFICRVAFCGHLLTPPSAATVPAAHRPIGLSSLTLCGSANSPLARLDGEAYPQVYSGRGAGRPPAAGSMAATYLLREGRRLLIALVRVSVRLGAAPKRFSPPPVRGR